MREWKRWEYKKPRTAKGGIKLRTGRNKPYSSNWWSRRWLRFIEDSIDDVSLIRGKTYARRGQVLSVEVHPGMIVATVQGSREMPYQVRLGFDTVSDDGRPLLLYKFREHASFVASLLAGEMPEELVYAFDECGTRLFPDAKDLRRFKCSCPDETEPCKHIVAVLLLLGEVFDDDPFLILKLRGIDKDKLINLLTMEINNGEGDYSVSENGNGETCEAQDWDDPREPAAITGGSDEISLFGEQEEETEIKFDNSWFMSDYPVFSYNPAEDQRHPAALEMMNEFPLWRGDKPFRQSLLPYYDRAAQHAVEILTGERRNQVGRPRKYE